MASLDQPAPSRSLIALGVAVVVIAAAGLATGGDSVLLGLAAVAGLGISGLARWAPRDPGGQFTRRGLLVLVAVLAAASLAMAYGWIGSANVSTAAWAWCAATAIALLGRFRSGWVLALAATSFALFAVEVGLLAYERWSEGVGVAPPTAESPATEPPAARVQAPAEKQPPSPQPERAGENTYTSTARYRTGDPVLGAKLVESVTTVTSKQLGNGEYVFRDVVYSTDDRGRRRSLGAAEDPRPDKHALFFGGSFTFGMGVADDATLPSQFETVSAGEYEAYNFGAGGYGTAQMYLQLGLDRLLDDIPQKSGIAVYSLIADHINRSTPHRLDRLVSFRKSPLFRLDAEGRLDGPFRMKDDPELSAAMEAFEAKRRASPLQRAVGGARAETYLPTDQALEVLAQLIVGAKARYDERFDGQFVVLLWPRMNRQRASWESLWQRLRDSGIAIVEVAELGDGAIIHESDGHPSAAEYRWVAQALYDFLHSNRTG